MRRGKPPTIRIRPQPLLGFSKACAYVRFHTPRNRSTLPGDSPYFLFEVPPWNELISIPGTLNNRVEFLILLGSLYLETGSQGLQDPSAGLDEERAGLLIDKAAL